MIYKWCQTLIRNKWNMMFSLKKINHTCDFYFNRIDEVNYVVKLSIG